MDSGTLSLSDIDGPFDLEVTIESGQTYLWARADGRTYETHDGQSGDVWYWTAYNDQVIRVRQQGTRLEWEATDNVESTIVDQLGLSDDLDAIVESAPDDPLITEAVESYPGLRIVRDPFFPCLISFICSTQMRVPRIFKMQQSLRKAYGDPINLDGRTYRTFPKPSQLAGATETELRALGLGYRAPYVRQTAEMVASGRLTKDIILGQDYETARETLTEFIGVGPKVADCVLLFSLGYLQAVPLDTWIRTAIEEYYPGCSKNSYAETSRALRSRFGGEFAGYVQTYVFHHLRTQS